jgi:acetyl esterase
MTLHPQCRAVLAAMAAEMPPIDFATVKAADLRATYGGPSPFAPGDEVESIEDRSIDGPGGALRLRIYRPKSSDGSLPITLYFHGGGFVFGAIEGHDNVCRSLAHRAQTLVVSVDYRLAPEAKFPAATEDAIAALNWVRGNASALGADGTRIAVAGDSAGGNLATVLARRARDAGIEVRQQLLLYPVTDWRFDTASYSEFAEGFLLTREMMEWFFAQYLPEPQAGAHPDAAPLRAQDLRGLAPATIYAAGFDPLRDENRAYASALEAAGVAVTLREWPDQIHGFISMMGAIDAADEAVDQAAATLRKAFAGSIGQD